MDPDECDDGLVRIMLGVFVMAVPREVLTRETRVMDGLELRSLLFECGLDPSSSDDALLAALTTGKA